MTAANGTDHSGAPGNRTPGVPLWSPVAAVSAMADDMEHGRAWVTVWHGTLETDQDFRLVEQLGAHVTELARPWPGCLRLRQGGSDYWAVQFQPQAQPGAPTTVALARRLVAYAREIAPAWWQVAMIAPYARPPARG